MVVVGRREFVLSLDATKARAWADINAGGQRVDGRLHKSIFEGGKVLMRKLEGECGCGWWRWCLVALRIELVERI